MDLLPKEFIDVCTHSAGAEVVYSGPLPTRSREWFRLTQSGYRVGYVYILISPMDVLYVGMSWCPARRFLRHRNRAWWRWVEDLVILRIEGDDADDTRWMNAALERFAIKQLRPICNVVGVS